MSSIFWTFVTVLKGGEKPGHWKTEFNICPQMFGVRSCGQYKKMTSENPNLLCHLSGCPSLGASLSRCFKLVWAIGLDPPNCRRRDVACLFHAFCWPLGKSPEYHGCARNPVHISFHTLVYVLVFYMSDPEFNGLINWSLHSGDLESRCPGIEARSYLTDVIWHTLAFPFL